jgi:transcriptional regulator with XRE-family HTH domain
LNVAENIRPHREFGRRMKAARALVGLTAIELAEKTEIKISMIRQYEHGRCLPGAINLHKIVTALDITTGDLFGPVREKEGVR